MFRSRHVIEEESGRFNSDLNLFYSLKGEPYFEIRGTKFTLNRWRKKFGRDLHSIIADPKFRSLEKRDFRLAKNSPALKLGFVPVDVSKVGPRPLKMRD